MSLSISFSLFKLYRPKRMSKTRELVRTEVYSADFKCIWMPFPKLSIWLPPSFSAALFQEGEFELIND